MAKDIRLSPKHGLNPSLGVCFYCGEDDGTVIIPGRLKGDQEAPRRAVWTKEPCPKCKDYMKQGILIVEVRDNTDKENPYRTGRLWVIKEEAAKKAFPTLGDSRFVFIEESAAKELGLEVP